MSRRRAARDFGLAVAVTVGFLTAGLPRWLVDDVGRGAGVDFAKLCREHGGAPRPAPGSGGKFLLCTVRYGRRLYLMDTITRHGFDAETARFQRQGCEEQARRVRRSATARARRQAFIYHPDTGVCERRP